MAISDWPASERPREKMLQRSASALSDAELLAIFLRTGVTGKSAVDLARELLDHFGGLRALLAADQKQFCQCHGLGIAKFTQLQACLEMSRRFLQENLSRGSIFDSPESVRQYLRARIRESPNEVFLGLFLDSRHRVIRDLILFQGTIDGSAVHPREVVRQALTLNAAALIVAHNHPSGVSEPSQADLQITRRLRDALALMDIPLLDHFIVGDSEVVSLAERGQL